MYNLGNKVLFVATVFSHLAAFHKPFMLMLKDKGYEIHAAASSSEGRMKEIQALGVKCWDIPFTRSPYSLQNIKAYSMLKRLFSNYHFQLIHVHTPAAAFIGRYLAKVTRQGPVIYTAHGFHFFKGAPLRNWVLYYSAERIASKWTDALIVMNEEDFKAGKRIGFIPDINLHCVHGVGVDLSTYLAGNPSKNFKSTLGLSEDSLVFTCVAEFIPRKNHKVLLKVWKNISDSHNNVELVLVGKGELKNELEEYVTSNGIPRVNFLGFRKDVPDILQNSDVVILLSKHEGLPRCIMEAMACGTPVIGTPVGGLLDVIKPGLNGLFSKDVTADGLKAAIEEFIKIKDTFNPQKIRSYIQENFSEELIAEKYIKLYNEILDK